MFFANVIKLTRYCLNKCFTTNCHLCGQTTRDNHPFCHPCQQALPILTDSCQRCARILPITSRLCGICLNQPPFFHKTFALFTYQAPITRMVVDLKFKRKLFYAHTLGNLLADRIQTTWYKNDSLPAVLLPVPLHVNRLKARGFNQSLEIAKHLARRLNCALDTQSVLRTKDTLAQSGLSAVKRLSNMKEAFTCKKTFAGETIAVIDDVVTTGHTVNALSKILIQHGAGAVHIWCCARR